MVSSLIIPFITEVTSYIIFRILFIFANMIPERSVTGH